MLCMCAKTIQLDFPLENIFGFFQIPVAPEGWLRQYDSGFRTPFSVLIAPQGCVFAPVSQELRGLGAVLRCGPLPARWVPFLDGMFVVSRLWKNIPRQASRLRVRRVFLKSKYPR